MNNDQEKSILRVSQVFLVMCLLTPYFYYFWFSVKNDLTLSTDPDDWAAFGDFLGGTLNPLIAFLTLAWLIRAVYLQQHELRATSAALAESSSAQQRTAKLQLIQAKLTAMSADLSTIQSDIDALRAERLFYTEGPHGLMLNGEVGLGPIDLLKELTRDIGNLIKERDSLRENIREQTSTLSVVGMGSVFP